MSEAQRSALNALLFRTGDQSRDIVLVLATNRPGDLDAAITDRIDEVIEFPLPGEEERLQLLKLYLNNCVDGADVFLSANHRTIVLRYFSIKINMHKTKVKAG